MVGVSPRDIRAAVRWFAGLSPRVRAGLSVGLVLLVGVIIWAVLNGQAEARLVSADPDAAAADAVSMKFAVDRGRGVFKQHCASCHGPDGQGRNTFGAANLTDREWLYGQGAASEIETVVLYGIRAPSSKTWRLADMPAFGTARPYSRYAIPSLSPGDINDVIQFLRVVEGRPGDAAAAARGGQIYAVRGGCYDCHGTDVKGDDAIGAPSLADNIWLYGDGSDKAIFQSIAYGRAGVCPTWAGRLSAVQIREVALYVYAISHGDSQPKPSLK